MDDFILLFDPTHESVAIQPNKISFFRSYRVRVDGAEINVQEDYDEIVAKLNAFQESKKE